VTDGRTDVVSTQDALFLLSTEDPQKTAITSLYINILALVMRKQLLSVRFELQLETTFALNLRKNINITIFCAYWLIICKFRAF
jgi:hypothetical protein